MLQLRVAVGQAMKCSTAGCGNLAGYRCTVEGNVILVICGFCATTARRMGNVSKSLPLSREKRGRK